MTADKKTATQMSNGPQEDRTREYLDRHIQDFVRNYQPKDPYEASRFVSDLMNMEMLICQVATAPYRAEWAKLTSAAFTKSLLAPINIAPVKMEGNSP